MKRRNAFWIASLAVATVLSLTSPAPAQAPPGSLWYNGDPSGFAGNTANGANFEIFGGSTFIYDDFIVPVSSPGWTITAVFSNDSMSHVPPLPMSSIWEIRSGVTPGNGGTLIASGSSPTLAIPVSGFGNTFTFFTPIAPVILAPGTYWLTVAPDNASQNSSYILATIGTNAVGMPPGNDGNSYFSSTSGPVFFEPVGTGAGPDFSMGVIGIEAVPESSTWIGASLAGLMLIVQIAKARSFSKRNVRR
jgi:hypothetical protein